MTTKRPETILSVIKQLAKALIEGEIAVYRQLRPDVYGTAVFQVRAGWAHRGAIKRSGAGVHTPRNKWNATTIQKAVQRIVDDERFVTAARDLGRRMAAMDGRRNSAEAIWRTIMSKQASGRHAPCLEAAVPRH